MYYEYLQEFGRQYGMQKQAAAMQFSKQAGESDTLGGNFKSTVLPFGTISKVNERGEGLGGWAARVGLQGLGGAVGGIGGTALGGLAGGLLVAPAAMALAKGKISKMPLKELNKLRREAVANIMNTSYEGKAIKNMLASNRDRTGLLWRIVKMRDTAEARNLRNLIKARASKDAVIQSKLDELSNNAVRAAVGTGMIGGSVAGSVAGDRAGDLLL